MEAFFATLLDNMKNQNGGKFSLKKQVVNNSWYSTHEMVDEDFLWIKSDHTVCRSLDWKILEQAITKEHLFDERENLNLLVYKAYDISTYQSKYRLRPRKNGEKLLPVIADFCRRQMKPLEKDILSQMSLKGKNTLNR